MSKNKKQHFIPKCYLKAWCDPSCPSNHEPYIWVYEKDSLQGKRKAPNNVFHETDMYTIRDKDGGRDLRIEHGLSELESMFATLRKKKFSYMRQLEKEEHFLMCAFIAAMHVRTRNQLDHISNQWRGPLKMADELAESMKTATKEQKQSMARMSSSSLGTSKKDPGFTHEQVREMVENPVGTMMLPMISAEADLLAKLDFAILTTDTQPGFITSDSPCGWFDPEAYKRPPIYRAPALMYETIEISLPISPSQCIFLNRQGYDGYHSVGKDLVNESNRRQRFNAATSFIVNQNHVDEMWFDPGHEPEDSWEKEQKKMKVAEKNSNN